MQVGVHVGAVVEAAGKLGASRGRLQHQVFERNAERSVALLTERQHARHMSQLIQWRTMFTSQHSRQQICFETIAQ